MPVQAASPARQACKRKRASKRSRPVYEQSETTGEQSSGAVSDADGFFDNLGSDEGPGNSPISGRTSSACSQDPIPDGRQALQSFVLSVPETKITGECEQDNGTRKPEPWTFVQCDIKSCQKWRRIITSEVPEGPWTCGMNHDPA